MLQLLLLRHAKSSWDDPDEIDIGRPLAPRGLAAARIMGQKLATLGLPPDLVLCSPATRARETWAIAAKELGNVPPVKTVQGVYDFGDGNGLLATIQEHAGSAGILLVVGHNPSMEELANRLIGRGARKLRDQLNAKFPTAALAVLRFELAKWKDLRSASAELTHFIRPRDVLTGKPC